MDRNSPAQQRAKNALDIMENTEDIKMNRIIMLVGILMMLILIAVVAVKAQHDCKDKVTLHEMETALYEHLTSLKAPTQNELDEELLPVFPYLKEKR